MVEIPKEWPIRSCQLKNTKNINKDVINNANIGHKKLYRRPWRKDGYKGGC
jgi:hypothetical protein